MPYVPLRWLADHVELPPGTTAEQVAADLVRVGLEEEAIHGPQVRGPLVVGRVLSVLPERQKNGKTVNWCQVDVGEPAPRGIVCGAHNFSAGDHVVVALPGAVLPGPFRITARKTYGHTSDGMIASPRELGLGDDHTGILVLSDEQVSSVRPGDDAVALLGLDETVVEINVTPDRGYCFSMRGVAREYGHSTGARFTDPGVPRPGEALPEPDGEGFAVELVDEVPIHGRAGCDRFVARIVRGIHPSAPSPAWMQKRLTQAGMRPISLAVDVTNYVMLELGQPLHAYDLDTLSAPIVVRRALPRETLRTLDGAERHLDPEDLLITDSRGGRGARPLGLAGVMGGADTEVTPGTSDVLIEAAHFDQISVARTARRHKLPSEAAKRFERGVDPRLPALAAQRVVDLLVRYGGGVADPHVTDVDETVPPSPVRLRESRPAELVGVPYTPADVRGVLEAIGCRVDEVDEVDGAPADVVLDVTPPSWRPDLREPADLVEEVARLQGYDRIPAVLPSAPAGEGLTADQRRRRAVARALAAAGLVEVLSYPFVGSVHDAFGIPAEDRRRAVVTLANPLSAEEPGMRTSVLDTLVQVARRNVGRGLTDVALFEIGLVTVYPDGDTPKVGGIDIPPVGVRPDDDVLALIRASVPGQPWHVAGVLTGRQEPAGVWGPGRAATWADAVDAVRTMAGAVRVEVSAAATSRAPWHPGRCAELRAGGPEGPVLGYAGELHPAVTTALELPPRSVAFEVDLDALLAASPRNVLTAEPVSVYPVAKEDVALVVDVGVPTAEVLAAVEEGAGDLAEQIRLFDVYVGDQVGPGRKSLAFSLRLRAHDRTLTTEETAAVRDAIVAAASRRVGGQLRT
jgi:phenylalanyl-tRNA synthetase beta chain